MITDNTKTLYNALEQIRELIADRDKYRDASERLIEHYGNRQTWGTTNPEYNEPDLYLQRNGMDFARQVKAEIEGTTKETIDNETLKT